MDKKKKEKKKGKREDKLRLQDLVPEEKWHSWVKLQVSAKLSRHGASHKKYCIRWMLILAAALKL